MLPNIKKSTLLSIRGNLRATLMRNLLTTVKEQRDLGLIVSSNLSWDENGNRQASKAMNALFNIKRSLTKNCSNETKVNAYTGYVMPIATYASQTWLPNRASTQKLERVQKVATPLILGSEKSLRQTWNPKAPSVTSLCWDAWHHDAASHTEWQLRHPFLEKYSRCLRCQQAFPNKLAVICTN